MKMTTNSMTRWKLKRSRFISHNFSWFPRDFFLIYICEISQLYDAISSAEQQIDCLLNSLFLELFFSLSYANVGIMSTQHKVGMLRWVFQHLKHSNFTNFEKVSMVAVQIQHFQCANKLFYHRVVSLEK